MMMSRVKINLNR